MGKRAKQEGTIYGPDKHGAWWAQLPAGPDGRRPRRKAATEAEALDKLLELRAERAAGRDHYARASTVTELMENLEGAEAPTLRPSSIHVHRTTDTHIKRRLGAMAVGDVTLETVQAFANWLATERKLSPGRVDTILGRLRAAYERVIPDQVDRNPVDWKKLKLRKVRSVERQPLEDTALLALLVAGDDLDARGADYRLAPAWWLIGLLGLRRGEALGATWKAIDWQRGTIAIRQQYGPDGKGRFALGPVKTAAGERVLPVGPRQLERLRAAQAAQNAERLRRGKDWHKHDLIVCKEDGQPLNPDHLYEVLKRVGRAAGIPHVFPHLLRHGVATAISEEGYSEAVIAAVLGHEKGGTVTRRYTHASPRAMRNAIEAIEARILGAATSAAREAR